MVKIVNQVDKSTTSVDYQTNGVKRIRISNNLSAIDVVGTIGDNAMLSTLKIVRLGSEVKRLLPGCFMNCDQLEEVDVPENCQFIEENAFRNCKSLTKIECIQGNPHVLKKIGTRGFAGCDGLEDITLNLNGNPAELYEILGNECFASCHSLERVKFTGSAYVSRRMFADCESLTSIQLANMQGYVYKEGLADIKSLETITIPNKTWIVNDGMFMGCESLSSVEFQDGDTFDTSSNIELFGNRIFEGCDSLTEIRIPKSITSFSQLGEEMLAGSQISCVRFDGIPRDYFGQYQIPTKLTYNTGKWYVGKDKKSFQTVLKIAKYAKSKRIPMIIQFSRDENVLSAEVKVKKKKKIVQYADKDWINILKGITLNKNYFYIKGWYDTYYATDMYNWINSLCDNELSVNSDAGYTYIILMWNKNDGFKYQIYENASRSNKLNTNIRFNTTLDSFFSGYTPPQTTVHEITENSNVTLLGLQYTQESCMYYASDGSYRIVKSDGTIKYTPKFILDWDSKVNFKTGRWYYNASQLKEFADRHNIPVVIEYSSDGCTPCEYWERNSFNNQDFQKWVSEQKFLFCRVEKKSSSESWTDPDKYPQLNFVEYQWVKAQEKGIPYPPVFCWYWKKNNQDEPMCDVSSYHFAQGAGSQPPWTDEQFYSMTTLKFADYREPSDIAEGLRCPTIRQIYQTGNTQYPSYLVYDNQYISALPAQLSNEYREYDRNYMFGTYRNEIYTQWEDNPSLAPDYYNEIDGDDSEHKRKEYIEQNYIKPRYKGEIDPNGAFFACEKKEEITKYIGKITLYKSGDSGETIQITNPTTGDWAGTQTNHVADGTYQVFLASNAYMYDRDSVIFRIRDGKIEYMFRCYNYVDEEDYDPQVGYKKNEWVVFQGGDQGNGLSSMINQAEQRSVPIIIAVHMEHENVDSIAQITDYVRNSEMYWLDLQVQTNSQFNASGTAANQFSMFINRSYIGGWGSHDTSHTPSLYIYQGCSTCGIGDPAVYVHSAMPMEGVTGQQITSWIDSKRNAQQQD